MLRNTFGEHVWRLGSHGIARPWQNAQHLSRGIWTRNISTPTQSLRATSARRLMSAPQQTAQNLTKTRTNPVRITRRNFHNTSRLRNAAKESIPKEPEPQGLSARLKKLSREYGWTAVGVYLGLSVLDFPFCFLLVRIVGTDRIGMPHRTAHVVFDHD